MKVLVTATSFRADSSTPANEKLRRFADEIVYNPVGRPLSEEELAPLLKDCDGYIAGLDFVTAKAISEANRLKVISRYGAGVDRVDLEAAKAHGVTVCNTPGANAQAVADLAFGLMLALARKIPLLDQKTKAGEWIRSTGIELYGKTLGILGLGAIGKGVAARAAGFNMRVMAYDPYINRQYAKEHGIAAVSFEEALTADIVSLHLPLNKDTRHIIGRKEMEAMKPGALLINTARGGLIDEQAACELLESGHLGGLGLDAYEVEPPVASPLAGLEKVIMTPHTASHTLEATVAMADMSVQNLIDVLTGAPCPYRVAVPQSATV